MKKLARLTAVLIVLLAFSSLAAAAAGPEPGPFSTTGYTTGYDPVLLSLPAGDIPGYAKFHLRAQGEPENAAMCSDYLGEEEPCGTDGFFPAGSFTFDEWGIAQYIVIVDDGGNSVQIPTGRINPNHGLMTITTATGSAEVRFGGIADYQTNPLAPTVTGSFTFLEGTDQYKGLKGEGTYLGNAGLVFKVDYTPCVGKDQNDCWADHCAVFGGDLKIKKDKIEWEINNEGKKAITASEVRLFWPVANGPITKVKLGKTTIYEGLLNPPTAPINLSGWKGKDKDLQIGKGEKLAIEFAKGANISTYPWDYTILVEFKEGCAVPFVAFAP